MTIDVETLIRIGDNTRNAGAGVTLGGFLSQVDWIGIGGLLIAAIGVCISVCFNWLNHRMKKREHEAYMEFLRTGERREQDLPVVHDRRQRGNIRVRVAVALLTVSAAGFATWQASESFVAKPMIPTKGDVPTIGYGSTRYEDGRPVRLSDAPITRERGEVLARNLMSADEVLFRASLPGVKLHQEEYDLYMDFVGQFGIGNWRQSSPRKHLLAGRYRAACDSLLLWKKQAGRDCSKPENWGPNGCKGVWTRQLERHKKCLAVQ